MDRVGRSGCVLPHTHLIYEPKTHNYNISVDNESNVTKSRGHVLSILLEGGLSQNFDLGPGYFSMLCRELIKVFCHYFLCFIS